MGMLMLWGILALNLLISWFNCKTCGTMWAESKRLGGWIRVLVWCGAIQAAIGFSSVIIFIEVYAAYLTGHLDEKYAQAAISLWYLGIIIPAIGTGLLITVHSWIVAYRERNWANMGAAAWNTFASAHNIYNAANGGVSGAWDSVSKLFKGGDSKDSKQAQLVILLVIISLAAGILITMGLIGHYDRKARLAIATGQRGIAA